MGIGSLSKLYVFDKPPFQLRVTSTFFLSNWAVGACLEIYVNYLLWGRLWMDDGIAGSGFNFTELAPAGTVGPILGLSTKVMIVGKIITASTAIRIEIRGQMRYCNEIAKER